MMTFSRAPRRFNQRPIIVSDSPPLLPDAHREYTSAVSIKLIPASTSASSRLNEVGSSAVQPKTLHPKHRGETSNPEFPSFRFFISIFSPRKNRPQRARRIIKEEKS